MTATAVVEQTRRPLGRVGAALPSPTGQASPVGLQRDAVRRLEQAGYRSAWVNEVIGKDALVQAAVLLAATDHLVVGTGVAIMWARPAQTAQGPAAQLVEAYPGRFVLGLGVGWPQQAASVGHEFGSPLATLRDYLNQMTAPSPGRLQAPAGRYTRIVGANGPRMLVLAGRATDGAMPAMQPPASTLEARRLLGGDKLLVVLIGASAARGDTHAIADIVREHLHARGRPRRDWTADGEQLHRRHRPVVDARSSPGRPHCLTVLTSSRAASGVPVAPPYRSMRSHERSAHARRSVALETVPGRPGKRHRRGTRPPSTSDGRRSP